MQAAAAVIKHTRILLPSANAIRRLKTFLCDIFESGWRKEKEEYSTALQPIVFYGAW